MIRAVLALGYCLGLVGCVHINQGSRPMGSIISQSERPQPGDWCRVTTPATGDGKYHRNWSEIVGRVASVDDSGIRLSDVVRESRLQNATPILSDLPVVGRRFKNSSVGRETTEIWTMKWEEIAQVEIISEEEGREGRMGISVDSQQNVAQHLVAAVPGRR